MKHNIKIDSRYFDAVVMGLKRQETRLDDRNYRVGDVLYVKEIGEDDKETNRSFTALVTHLITSNDLHSYSIKLVKFQTCGEDNYIGPKPVIMSIEVLSWSDGQRIYKGAGINAYRKKL
jgi:hypothetical protein